MDGTTTPVAHGSQVQYTGPHVSNNAIDETVDIYTASAQADDADSKSNKTVPFVQNITIDNVNGERIRVRALFDDGAMINAMCTTVFETVKHRLKGWIACSRPLRMANGTIIPAVAQWTGTIRAGDVKTQGTFVVFNSGGGWAFLVGKPLLIAFKAQHDYNTDQVTVSDGEHMLTLHNRYHDQTHEQVMGNKHKTLDIKQRDTDKRTMASEGPSTKPCAVNQINSDEDIFTRQTNPFNIKRIEYIQKAVKIGNELTTDEKRRVGEFIAEYADVFACSIKEVLLVPGASIDLNIPKEKTFTTSPRQRPLSPPQKAFMHTWVQQMLDAGMVEPANIKEIKHVAPTVLTQKTHEDKAGMTLKDLQQELNEQCRQAGIEVPFPNMERKAEGTAMKQRTGGSTTKWRVTQNFAELNKVAQIPPMHQGDIRAKQQRLSGHKYVSVFDFASGFYAIEVPKQWRPYLTFFVEGRGYFWYTRMAMGLTGAPTTFSATITTKLHDLLATNIIELFVDDGGTSDNTFNGMLDKLRKAFQRFRENNLSISPTKCKLFMSETTFAGATVGPNGVQPDIAKLTAIVNWKQPEDALNLSSFLGLTGHFRDLIKGYAKIEGPLRNLVKDVDVPKPVAKTTYRRAMTNYKLKDRWRTEHTRAFLHLKAALTNEPVLHAPKYDGTPFIVTTDGCQEGLGAVLTQRIQIQLPSGKTVNKIVPIAFASKRTSASERNYKPFLLEFAALKYGLDHFSDVIWGYPVEVETDCQALRDVLANDNISAAHARWRDGILAHNIVAVRHIPGKLNVVADGLSRQWDNTERTDDDGSQWSVNPEPKAMTGLVNDVFALSQLDEKLQRLRDRFTDEPMFLEVIDAILNVDTTSNPKDRSRARHRASQYLIEDGRLWRIYGKTNIRPRSRTECITRQEAEQEAKRVHNTGGHWGRDALKIALTDRYYSPKIDISIMKAITDCAKCKSFGTQYIHSLLEPITRRHPFELLVGDYLSMPTGKGGYHTLGLFMDTFSQHLWVTKFKTAGTAKTTIDSLSAIFNTYVAPETFMTDGGKHFDNHAVKEFCRKWSCKHHVVAAYSPWVNGLVEGTNKLLLHVLKRLCAPELGEDDTDTTKWERLPGTWPDHLDNAVRALNNRLLPAFKHTPKELLLGLVVDTKHTRPEDTLVPLDVVEAATHMAYAAQQRLDGYNEAVKHAVERKRAFDRRVLRRHPGEVVFNPGQLVQIYRSDTDYTFKTERKLLPKWSTPHRIAERLRNAYKLVTLNGTPLHGEYSARRLRAFTPREGTKLHTDQVAYTQKLQEKMGTDEQVTEAAEGDDEVGETVTEEG